MEKRKAAVVEEPEFLTKKLKDGADQHSWARPAVPAFDPNEQPLIFMQYDVDYYVGKPLPGMPGASTGEVPVLRMYGVTETGNSVLAHVHGVTPYFYCHAPAGYTNCEVFRNCLNGRVPAQDRKNGAAVLGVTLVQKESVMNYNGGSKGNFFKIFTAIPKNVVTVRSIVEKGFEIPGHGTFQSITYESNIPFALRFMIDRSLVGGNWVECLPTKYKIRPNDTKTSHCQLEIDLAFHDFISHAPEGAWLKLAPLRILSFDIECAARKGHFPSADQDPVIQIANVVTLQGDNDPIIRNVFTLKSCSSIVGAEVCSFEEEGRMLQAWRDFVSECDPDIITGYNIVNFDLPYLLNRAEHLKVGQQFAYLGRITQSITRMKDTTFSSKAYGTRENKEITIDGRVQFDMLQVIQRDYKLRSYTLNSVSAHFLGEQKEDVHHSIITDLQNGGPDTRRRLAVYCLKDAYLPTRLLQKLLCMYNYIEMARVTGVPLGYLLTRGQQIKVLSQLYRKAAQFDMIIPSVKSQGTDDKYEGAVVIDPKKGFYEQPIATLDFASLYPSIMMAHNLCYTTLVRKEDVKHLSPDQYMITPTKDVFVRSSVRKGILPLILEELLSARKRAKEDIKLATDPLTKAVLDGRQLALKISANSVYGFTGAQVGQLPCLEISSSVTSFGREMIEATKNYVEEKYTIENGYSHNADVVYGDTDSVMVKFGVTEVAEAMELGREAAEYVSSKFVKPIKLEFEKVYFPFLLMNKKRYAALLWTRPEKHDKMDAKGIETVRRDNCGLVKDVVDTCLQKILIERSVEGAIAYAKNLISDLLQNRVDLSLLVITKALGKSANSEDYSAKQAHVELAERMRKRDAGSAPAVGDRVPYVVIRGTKDAKAYEKSEDPIYVLDNNIPIDTAHYLEHQLKQPLIRIFEAILPNTDSLFSGEHTRSVSIPVSMSGALGKFVVKRVSCLSCKSQISEGALCQHCKDKEPEIYMQKVLDLNHFERQFSKLWTECQRCQGSLHQDVLCTSRDCPIFYRRKKVQKDLKDAQAAADRFSLAW
eukprot:GILK01006561.1.p1 GENE.GILK01006561.1~~GILK01006561.1.p1  ORF type:complete len:1058 (-),score=188.44 GILK01006561.1:44-3172(-)